MTPKAPAAAKPAAKKPSRKPQADDHTSFHRVEDNEMILPELAGLPLSPDYKKIEDDWPVAFNPAVPRLLDVDKVHTIVHDSVPCTVKFSMDGGFVATGCNKSAHICDVISGEELLALQLDDSTGGDMYVRSVCFSPDGKYLATGSEDSLGMCLGHRFMHYQSNLFWPRERLGCLCNTLFSGRPHDASGGGDHTIRLWSVKSGSNTLTLRIGDIVTGVSISPDGQLIAAGSRDKSIHVWNLRGDVIGQNENPYEHEDTVFDIAFSPNCKQLVTGSFDKTAKLWDLDSSGHVQVEKALQCARTFMGHRDIVISVAMTPNNY